MIDTKKDKSDIPGQLEGCIIVLVLLAIAVCLYIFGAPIIESNF